MIAYGKTDKGIVRSNNQDNFACGVFDDGAAWAVVCDGMGGVIGGDIASSIAVETAKKVIAENYKPRYDSRHLKKIFAEAASAANTAVYEKAKETPDLMGMGTTIVIAIVKKGKAHIAHAGDSRAYILNDTARPVTKDHSVVQELVDCGRITPEAALNHPHRNIITRALGVGKDITVDFETHRLSSGERVLICSDGLTNCVSDTDLALLSKQSSGEVLPEKLIEAANSNGGFDNITAVIICE